MNKIEKFEEICSKGESFGPVSMQCIEQSQSELGVVFPKDYQNFLEKYGALLANMVEIYGLPDENENDPPLWGNVISITKSIRNLNQIGSERKYLIPISSDGMGSYFFIDTRFQEKSNIYAIGPGIDINLSTDFIEFVINMSNGHEYLLNK